jgi:hypothetical protein
MNIRNTAIICCLVLATPVAYAQSATLVADVPVVAASSVVRLTASANYPVAPNAVGWSVTLPEGWTFVATGGPDAPQVGPQDGATGTLEWAYADVPANAARFSFTVKASSRPGALQLTAKVFLRVEGKQQAVEVAPAKIILTP